MSRVNVLVTYFETVFDNMDKKKIKGSKSLNEKHSSKVKQLLTDFTEIKRPIDKQKNTKEVGVDKSATLPKNFKTKKTTSTQSDSISVSFARYEKKKTNQYNKNKKTHDSTNLEETLCSLNKQGLDIIKKDFVDNLKQKKEQLQRKKEEIEENKLANNLENKINCIFKRKSFIDIEELLKKDEDDRSDDSFGFNHFEENDEDNYILETYNKEGEELIKTTLDITRETLNRNTLNDHMENLISDSDYVFHKIEINDNFSDSSNDEYCEDPSKHYLYNTFIEGVPEPIYANWKPFVNTNKTIRLDTSPDNKVTQTEPKFNDTLQTILKNEIDKLITQNKNYKQQEKEEEEYKGKQKKKEEEKEEKQEQTKNNEMVEDEDDDELEEEEEEEIEEEENEYAVNNYSTVNAPIEQTIFEKNESSKKKEKIYYQIEEIKETEELYIKGLAKVIKFYLPYLRKHTPQALLGRTQYIFGNIEDIYKNSKQFLNLLTKTTGNDADSIADIFITTAPKFELYTLYSKNKPTADIYLKEFGSIIKERQCQINDKLGLGSYLLTPIQRLGKYVLMLEGIQRELIKSGKSTAKIAAAIKVIRNVMRKGNDYIAIDSIKNCDIDLSDKGSFIMRAPFNVLKPRKFLSMVFLFEHIIVFTEKLNRSFEHFIYVDNIPMSDLSLAKCEEKPNIFYLENYTKAKRNYSNATFILEAESPKVKHEWTTTIGDILWKQLLKAKEDQVRTDRVHHRHPRTISGNVPVTRKSKNYQLLIKPNSKFYDNFAT